MPGTTLPNLGLTGDIPDHSIWGNEGRGNDRRVDALVQLSVIDKDLTNPPSAPLDGDRYIVGPSAGGLWSGKDGQVAVFNAPAAAWTFYAPKAGWLAWVADESKVYLYRGSSWEIATTSPELVVNEVPFSSLLGPVLTGTDNVLAAGGSAVNPTVAFPVASYDLISMTVLDPDGGPNTVLCVWPSASKLGTNWIGDVGVLALYFSPGSVTGTLRWVFARKV